MAHHKLTVIGKVAGDVRSNELTGGGRVAHFGLPINFTRPKKDPETGEWKGDSFFINVDVFNRENYKLADMCLERLKKGSLVYVEGRLRNNEYTDRQGVKVSRPVLVADIVEFLDGRGDGMEGGSGGETVSRAPRPAATAPAKAPAAPARDDFEEEYESPKRGGGGGNEEDIPF
jgi:single-strand DNA-binding protein